MHIANILKEKELNEVSVVKNILTTAADGKNYNVVFYFNVQHKQLDAQTADAEDLKMLEDLEKRIIEKE